MPVVQRQIIPKGRSPSGLEKFLSVASTGVQVAGGVSNLMENRKRTKLEAEQLAMQKDKFERDKIREDTSLHDKEDAFLVNALAMQTKLARDQSLQTMQQGGAQVDPLLFGSAITLGDVTPAKRGALRQALARLTGQNEDAIDNSFVLSEENLPAVLTRQKALITLQEMSNPANQSAYHTAAGQGIAKDLSGSGEARPLGQINSDDLLADFMQNELLRKDPITGQVTGILVNNPRQALEDARNKLGLDRPLTEMDIDGRRILVSSETYDQIFRDTVQDSLIEGRARRADERGEARAGREAYTNAAIRLSEETKLPVDIAQRILNGDTQGIDPKYAVLVKNVQDSQDAHYAALAATKPFAALGAFAETAKAWGIDGAERLAFITSMAKAAHDKNPDIPIPINPGFISRFLNFQDRYQFSGGQANAPQGFGPAGTIGSGQRPVGVPGAVQADFQRALPAAAEGIIELATKMNPDSADYYLNHLSQIPMIGADGQPLIVTPDMIDYMRQQIAAKRTPK